MMVCTRARTVEIPSTPKRETMALTGATPPQSCRLSIDKEGKMEMSLDYEKCREQRIRENMERMQKMGIMDLALKFKSSVSRSAPAFKKSPSQRSTPSPLQSSKDLPRRRSSRLQNTSPISYSEREAKTKQSSASKRNIFRYRGGTTEEIYSDEHVNMLGDCESSWTLFADGYDGDGRRIYDPVKGKTCHQCRQKTLGHRTECSSCSLLQGQFCGDCLYMRYGENVLEAIQNPNWVCPVCRGICNCSLCRVKRGWLPTGIMYKKILRLGFKSVAHYLVHSKMEGKKEEAVMLAPQISAQRSLAFPDEETKSPTGEDSCAKKVNRQRKPNKEAEESTEEREAGNSRSPREKKMKAGRPQEPPPNPDFIAGRLRSRLRVDA